MCRTVLASSRDEGVTLKYNQIFKWQENQGCVSPCQKSYERESQLWKFTLLLRSSFCCVYRVKEEWLKKSTWWMNRWYICPSYRTVTHAENLRHLAAVTVNGQLGKQIFLLKGWMGLLEGSGIPVCPMLLRKPDLGSVRSSKGFHFPLWNVFSLLPLQTNGEEYGCTRSLAKLTPLFSWVQRWWTMDCSGWEIMGHHHPKLASSLVWGRLCTLL